MLHAVTPNEQFMTMKNVVLSTYTQLQSDAYTICEGLLGVGVRVLRAPSPVIAPFLLFYVVPDLRTCALCLPSALDENPLVWFCVGAGAHQR